jgi:hypothetical protein
MSPDQVVPVEEVQALAGQIAVIASVSLIQAEGDAANAVSRLESMRGQVDVMADNGSGFRMDVVQAAQEAVEQAAQINEAEDA